jgi:hypothetical protein
MQQSHPPTLTVKFLFLTHLLTFLFLTHLSTLQQVELDTEYLRKQDCQAILIRGGKAKIVSLVLPKRIFNAMLETSMIKKHMLEKAQAGMLFFVDLNGKPISLKSPYDTAVAEEVFQVMGVPRYTATEA